LELGLITLTAKSRIRLLPPLNISDEELDEGLELLEKAIRG
jgi:4-aminobutyrate aminotransferase-like enzyme